MNIAAYCRVSTLKDAQLDSLDNQKLFFKEYAEKNNHLLVKMYADEGISGKALKNRTQFNQMIKDAESGYFEMIVVKDISRFARNTVDFLQSVRTLKSQGVEALFLSNNQTVLGNSEFIITVFSALAQEESSNLSKRVKFGKTENAKKGRVPNTIYGYNWIDNFTLEINEVEAEVVKHIFYLYTQVGDGFRKIAIKLNAEKIPTKKGSQWSPKTIKRMIGNKLYNGIVVNHKMEVTDFIEGKIRMLPEGEWLNHIRDEYKIIDDDIFNKAQETLNIRQQQYKNETHNTQGRYSNRHLFSTLIKCEHCGYSYSRKVYQYKNSFVKWKCTGFNQFTSAFCPNNTTIDEYELTESIKEYFSSILSNQEQFINKIAKDYEIKNQTAPKDNAKTIRNKIQKLEYTKEKLKTMFSNDIIDIKELKEKIAELDLQKSEFEKMLIDAPLAPISEKEIQMQIISYLKSVNNFLALEKLTNADMKKLINKIVVNKDGEVKIHLNLYTMN